MEKYKNLAIFPKTNRLKCPVCEDDHVQTAIEMESFTYGRGSEAVELTARVPVRTCDSCGFQFTDHIAEDARHNAVCQHLGVMTPKEIAAIRKRYELSSAKFADTIFRSPNFSLGAQASVAWVKWTFQRLDDCYYVNESDWGTVLLPFLVSLFLPVWGCSALGKRQAVCTKAAF
jgi:hypothetical protein